MLPTSHDFYILDYTNRFHIISLLCIPNFICSLFMGNQFKSTICNHYESYTIAVAPFPQRWFINKFLIKGF